MQNFRFRDRSRIRLVIRGLYVNVPGQNEGIGVLLISFREEAVRKSQRVRLFPDIRRTVSVSDPVPGDFSSLRTQAAAGFQRQISALFFCHSSHGHNVGALPGKCLRDEQPRIFPDAVRVADVAKNHDFVADKRKFVPQNLRAVLRDRHDIVKAPVIALVQLILLPRELVSAVVIPQHLPLRRDLVDHVIQGNSVLGVGHRDIVFLFNGSELRPHGQPQLDTDAVVNIGQEQVKMAQNATPFSDLLHGKFRIQRVPERIQKGYIPADLGHHRVLRIHHQQGNVITRLRECVNQVHQTFFNSADSQSVADEQQAFLLIHSSSVFLFPPEELLVQSVSQPKQARRPANHFCQQSVAL